MPQLPGGDVIPSILSVQRGVETIDSGRAFDNTPLRLGEVQEIVYPDDDRSRSRKFVEYRVLVQQRSNGTGYAKMYENVLLMSSLGGLADFSTHTLRADKSENKDKVGLGKGSKVLILCVNGESNQAVIVGGMRDQTDDRDKAKAKDLGHYLVWEFNGVSVFINKDGEFEIQYKGKTEIDGKVSDDVSDDAKTSRIQLKKNGDIKLATKDEKQLVHLDAEHGKVIVQRDKNLEIGDATDKMLLGESFRNSQKEMNNKVKGYADAAKNLLQQAGTQLQSAGGSVAGPFMAAAAGPQITAAGALILAASNVLGQIAQAIGDFEQAAGQKNDFLSKKNKSD